jgi:3-hydroxyisobutyrate dehydrogenase-like beta-hydroxyacid dehydrogenase
MDTVGFIGVGMMGGAIAARMLEHGVPVLAYDNNPATLEALVAKGAGRAESVKDIVDRTEIVFACLPTADICKQVALGNGGAIEGSKVKVYIETSSLGGDPIIEISDAMAAKGIEVLDCPVIGGTMSVASGNLGVLVGGPGAAYEKAKPALESFAGKIFYLGEKPGMGQVGKVVNNSVAYALVLASCEAVAVALKAGLDMDTAIDIINSGSGANFFTQKVMPNFIAQGKFEGTGAIEIGLKDVKLFLAEAARLEAETPMAKSVSALQKTIVESGPAGRDTMEIFHYFTDVAGVPRQG